MKNDWYCNRADEESHFCRECEECYCNRYREPTFDEIEVEIERMLAESEAKADRRDML